ARVVSGDYEEKEFVRLAEQDPYSQDGINRWQEAISAWVEPQEGDYYKPPTEYCGSQSDLSVVLERPENEKTYDSQDVEFVVKADSGAGIEKIEIIVDDKVVETVESREYRGTVTISAGRHTVWAKGYARDGKTKDSEHKKIGTGGVAWQEPTATPTTAPTAVPTAVPTTPPSPTPTKVVGPPATPTPTP
ncbi:MAG: hypothetical protein KDA17_08230, partial [Candidatus Saccharibacteria bacterium]|nr:hypothetical protein [Candidatus Saccharibacteria bacterium]